MKTLIHRLTAKSFYYFCRLIFSSYCRLKVKGTEHLPPPPYILCSNHCSHLDSPALMLATGLPFGQFGMVAAKDYFFGEKKNKSWLSWFMNLLPVERKPGKRQIEEHIQLCRQFCEQKRGVLIFYPEGTRSMTGKIQRFKKGISLYAMELGLPIVPVHLEGTYTAFRKGKRMIRPTTIRVNIGPSLHIGQEVTLKEATQQLESTILSLKESHV